MLDADIWNTLDSAQKKKMESLVNSEWDHIQKCLKMRLMEVAGKGERVLTMIICHEVNANRVAELFKQIEGFTCVISQSQAGTFKTEIRF